MKKQSLLALTLLVSAPVTQTIIADEKMIESAVKSDITPVNIRYVDPYKALASLDQWKDKTDVIQKEIDTRAHNIDGMKKSGQEKQEKLQGMRGTATDYALEKTQKEILQLGNEIRIEEEALQNYAQNAAQKAQMEILHAIEEATSMIAKAQNIDFILPGPVLYASPKFDITQDVIALMNQQYANKSKVAKAPAVKPTTQLAKVDDKAIVKDKKA